MEFSEALLSIDPAFDSGMILLDDVVQVLDRSMPTPAVKRAFLFNSRDAPKCRSLPVCVDHPWLRMRSGAESLAKQPLGGSRIAERMTARKSMVAPIESIARYR